MGGDPMDIARPDKWLDPGPWSLGLALQLQIRLDGGWCSFLGCPVKWRPNSLLLLCNYRHFKCSFSLTRSESSFLPTDTPPSAWNFLLIAMLYSILSGTPSAFRGGRPQRGSFSIIRCRPDLINLVDSRKFTRDYLVKFKSSSKWLLVITLTGVNCDLNQLCSRTSCSSW